MPRATFSRAAGSSFAGLSARPPIASFGPGVDVTFPNDPYLIPFMAMEEPRARVTTRYSNRITTDLLKNARLIATPDERSLALQRIANGAIGANQLSLAHQTLEEAITATSDVTVPLVRDQRLIAIVTSLSFLTEALLREGNQSLSDAARLKTKTPAPRRCPSVATAKC